MFSATLSETVKPICRKFMQNPTEHYVDEDTKLTLHGLQQYYIKLEEKEKNRKLNELLDDLQFNQVIIFVKSTVRATELDKLLRECNFPSIAVHSGVSQDERYVVILATEAVTLFSDANGFSVSVATRSSRSSRRESALPLTSSVVVLISSVLTSPSTTISPATPALTFTVSVVLVVSVPRVSRSPLSALMPTRRCSRRLRSASRLPFRKSLTAFGSFAMHTNSIAVSSPRRASTPAPTWLPKPRTWPLERKSGKMERATCLWGHRVAREKPFTDDPCLVRSV